MVRGVMRGLIIAIISTGSLCLGGLASAIPPPEPTANISVDAGSVAFGNVVVHSSSGAVTLTVTNNGNVGLEIDIVVINGTDASEFIKSVDNCSSQTVLPASTCTVDVSFDPVVSLAKTAVLSIPSNDPETPVFDVSLSGIGEGSDITVLDAVGGSGDLTMDFGDLMVGLDLQRAVEITNDGNVDLNITNITPSGAPFSLVDTNGCSNITLAPSESCVVYITYVPDNNVTSSDSIIIWSDDPDAGETSVTVSLAGMGWPDTNSVPTAPVLENPGDGQTGVSLTVDFKWKESTDNDNDTLTYYLHYSDNQEFIGGTVDQVAFLGNKGIYFSYSGLGFLMMGLVFAAGEKRKRIIPLLIFMAILTGMLMVSCGYSEESSSSTPSDSITQQVSGLSASTTYYWKVVADDGKGGMAESSVRSFTTQ